MNTIYNSNKRKPSRHKKIMIVMLEPNTENVPISGAASPSSKNSSQKKT